MMTVPEAAALPMNRCPESRSTAATSSSGEPAISHGGMGHRWHTEDATVQIAEPGLGEMRQIEPPHRPRGVAEGVGALVAVFGGVGCCSGSARIHDHDDGAPERAHRVSMSDCGG